MIDKAVRSLTKKHLLICGKSETERAQFINQVVTKVHYSILRFPKGMKSLYDYLDFVRAKKLYEPWYTKKGKFGTNQILDFHRDWISDSSHLVIMEELQKMEDDWHINLIRLYLDEIVNRKKGEKVVHLIISQESENGLLDKLCEAIGVPNDNRTKRQIFNGCFEQIEI